MTLKQELLTQLQELRQDIYACKKELDEVKVLIKPVRQAGGKNLHPSNMNLSQKIWERSFSNHYGAELLEFFRTNMPRWVLMGKVNTNVLRRKFVHNDKRLGIKTVIQAHNEYCKYNGVIAKKG